MNIQANLPALNFVPHPAKVTDKQSLSGDKVDNRLVDQHLVKQTLSLKKTPRPELFEKIELLDKKQSKTQLDKVDTKQNKPIQSYLQTQSLSEQAYKDELHEQLGIDILA
ncbi:MAG: hypothetical protein KUG64_06560 [Cycloclasticus sp.]|nr:hypothetical protein [Cycloclasticus sp.]